MSSKTQGTTTQSSSQSTVPMILSTPPSYIDIPSPLFSSLSLPPSSSSPREEPFFSPLSSPFQAFYTAPSSPSMEAPTAEPESIHHDLTNILQQPPRPLSPTDESFPAVSNFPADMTLDDEGLSTLEKIYLFSRSKATFHRIFIAHALPSFLEQVTSVEAVEYVLPLLSGLAMDEDESVKEALAAELVPIIWWFFSHCQIFPDDQYREDDPFPSSSTTTPISVQAFTPILGTFLLSPNATVSAAARYAVVDLLSKIRKVNEGLTSSNSHKDVIETPPYIGMFGTDERQMFENEILQQVVIGMGRLEGSFDGYEEENDGDEYGTWPLPARGSHQPSEHGSDTSANGIEAEGGITPQGVTPDHKDDMTKYVENPNPYFPVLSSSLTLPTNSPASSVSSSTASSISDNSSSGSSPSSAAVVASNASTKASPADHGTRVPVPPPDRQDYFTIPEGSGSQSNPYHIVGTDITLPSTPSGEWRTNLSIDGQPDSTETPNNDLNATPVPRPGHDILPTQSTEMEHNLNDEELETDVDDEQAAVGRLSSLSLMAAVTASGLLKDYMKTVFVAEVERVGQDPIYWVRREVSFTLGALAKVLPEEVVLLSLLPIFHSLRQDPVWHVRHSALFALPAILSRLSGSERRVLALETIVTLSTDVSGTVRSAVLEALGEVLYTFHVDDEGPPEELVRLFIGRKDDKRVRDGQQQRVAEEAALLKLRGEAMSTIFGLSSSAPLEQSTIDDPQESFFTDPARPLVCAFNYPAVALTLGRKRWTGDFRQVYLDLAENRSIKVRKTLAASLGELAKIIGAEHAQIDLVPVWWDAVRCEDEEVRIKALECVTMFVEVLDETSGFREEIIGGLWSVWQEGIFSGWRERQTIGLALSSLVKLTSELNSHLIRQLLCNALEDSVAAVREAAISSLSQIWMAYHQPHLRASLDADLQTLLNSEFSKKRITFVACQQALMIPMSEQAAVVPDDVFWEKLTRLVADPILGVRIGLARLTWIACDLFFPGEATLPPQSPLRTLIKSLSNDPSHEVRSFVPYNRQGERQYLRQASAKFATFSRPPPTTVATDI